MIILSLAEFHLAIIWNSKNYFSEIDLGSQKLICKE
jgi:hypothetical protein